ncbi:MAG TPA: SpoIIE family protein phosphatase [Frankiaceae bacterium]|nr:SpoIIE family protein phosphatase [Frankiaceae bacterium]
MTVSTAAERSSAATAVESSWPAVVVTSPDGTIVHWSDSATAVYGWGAEEVLGRNVAEVTADPSEAERAAAAFPRLARGESWEGPFRVRHRDGSSFMAHVRSTPILAADGGLVAVVGFSYPVGEARFPLLAAERSARHAAERAGERLRRLQQATVELSTASTVGEVARVALERGMEIEGAGSGALWLLDERAGGLRFAASYGAAPGTGTRFALLPLDADLPGPAVVRSGRAIYLRSVAERDERWPALAGVPTQMQAQAIVPLVVESRVIGCLSFGFAEEREFGAGERDFLSALGNVCAQVLDRARLHEAERRASARVAFLAEASRVLGGSLDYEQTLQHVVELLLDAFASFVIIDVVDGNGVLQHAAMAHVDPAKRPALERLADVPLLPDTPVWEVLQTGSPRIVPEVSDEALRHAAGSDERYEAAKEIALGSAMIVPMTARGRMTGLLFLARDRGGEEFADEDLTLAMDLAARAAGAMDNARLFAARTAVAETLQRSLLPPSLPDVPGLELAARYRPALAGLEVGGDFYDCYAVRDGWAFMIGDVVGTGPKAAAVTAVVRHTARAVAPYVSGPREVVHAVRDALEAGDDPEVFCTLLYGSIERRDGAVTLRVVGAGHPQPYVVAADGTVRRVPTSGGLLGMLPPVGLDPVETVLLPGDALVCVTDGVLEARQAPSWDAPGGGDAFFDEAGLVEVLERVAGRSADEIAGDIEAAVLEFAAGRAPDDVAVLVLRAR